MTYPVTVSNLSTTTSEKSLSEFFTFCGKIASIQFDQATLSAVISFERQQAAKTALMLNGGSLDGATITVASDAFADEPEHETAEVNNEPGYEQHDKPRAGIVAEILAKGYALSDQILHKAIEVDKKQGISTRFLNYIRGLDTTIGQRIGGPEATVSGKAKEALAQGQEQAKTFDEQHSITKQAGDYYAKAVSSPLGQKVFAFYTTAAKQVADVHEEAKRIRTAEKEREAAASGSVPPATSA